VIAAFRQRKTFGHQFVDKSHQVLTFTLLQYALASISMETVLLWIGLGILLFVMAYFHYQDWPFITSQWVRVEAEVVRHDESFSDGDEAYKAVVVFADQDGTLREVLDLVAYTLASPPIGTRLEIVYPLGLPQKARIRHPVLRTLLYLVVGLMAAVMGGRIMGWLGSQQVYDSSR
jgi:hypothetical protein